VAKLPNPDERDPTLEAADRALEARAASDRPRPYLGASSIGDPCSRKLWYRFRWAAKERFDAATLKRFADGHASEAVQAVRLRLVEGVTLVTIDPESGGQIGFRDLDGHYGGHADGMILGIHEAPKTWHVWEHKSVNEKSLNELRRIRRESGQKAALRRWKPEYWAQAQQYMHYLGASRHYLTASSPGCRDAVSVRTDADPASALELRAKAERIIRADAPPVKLSETPDRMECRWCTFTAVCHGSEMPARNCRTCLHSTPVARGGWHCARWDRPLSAEEQAEGCPAHLLLPGLVPGEPAEAGETWVRYRMADGGEWTDSEASRE
jgi:hypothetical protein